MVVGVGGGSFVLVIFLVGLELYLGCYLVGF